MSQGHLVGGHPKGKGVRLGEHVLAVEFFEDAGRDFLGYAVGRRAVSEPLPVQVDQGSAPAEDEGPPQLVGLAGAETSDVHR